MEIFPVHRHLQPHVRHASGTVIGEDHRLLLAESIMAREPAQWGLDFQDIEFTTGSYLKRTLLWLWRCGELAVSGQLNSEEIGSQFGGATPVARPVFPFVCNLSDEVRGEISEVFASRSIPIIEAVEWTPAGIARGQILGRAETAVIETLDALYLNPSPETSAKVLCERQRSSGLGLSAWGNRLVELHRLRLLDRRKQGKEWIYLKLAEELTYG